MADRPRRHQPSSDEKIYIYVYYIDTSVLLENIPLVKFIKLHPGPEWFIFHNLTRRIYRWRNFGHFPLLFYRCRFVCIIKRTLHGGLKIWTLFSRGKNNILLTRCACSSKIKFISSRHRVISSLYIAKEWHHATEGGGEQKQQRRS